MDLRPEQAEERLSKLKQLRDKNLISEKEYSEKKDEIIKGL